LRFKNWGCLLNFGWASLIFKKNSEIPIFFDFFGILLTGLELRVNNKGFSRSEHGQGRLCVNQLGCCISGFGKQGWFIEDFC